MGHRQPTLDLSPRISDEIRKTTCYMCACRCGIDVHLKDGRVAYIEGNRDHPVNKGVLCAKGSAGIMQVNAPSRLRAPLRRTGPRGSGQFEEITWEEALQTATDWMAPLRAEAPEKLAFFTGRDQSQSLTSYWAQQFGTPNYAAHGGFCSVNMAVAGITTMGGAFWEFGQPDWERTKLLLLFGVAEDHDSNPIKMGIGRLKARGARVIGINPVRSGYNAVADDWFGITPGTDGLLILSLVHCLLKAGRIDLPYLAQFTNAPVLVNGDPDSPEHGLFLRDAKGKPLVLDRKTRQPVPFDTPGVTPDLAHGYRRAGITHRPVFQHLAERYLSPDYAPEQVAERCGIPAPRIRALAAELARTAFDEAIEIDQPWTDFRGRTHATMTGRPVAMHAMRGISAHSNGFQTARALHILQILLGTVETPGGFRFKPPYPKPMEAHPKPHASATPGQPLAGPHLGFPQGPEDLALDETGQPQRIDKAFTWENPLSAHGLMHMVIANAHAGDPYRIDTLFLYMANMAWNSSMGTGRVIEMLTDTDPETGDYIIPRIIYSDAYSSEMVAYADLILPDTTYLERHDCISLLDRPISEAEAAADAIRWPVIEPDRDVRGFQSVLIDLGARLGLPGFVTDEGKPAYADYADYIVNHQRRPGIGPLMGFRGEGQSTGRGDPHPEQLERYVENGGFFTHPIPERRNSTNPGTHAHQDWAIDLASTNQPPALSLQPLAGKPFAPLPARRPRKGPRRGRSPAHPTTCARSIKSTMDPAPPLVRTLRRGEAASTPGLARFQALTQRPMAMYHSWGSQNAWLRQVHGENPLYLPTRPLGETWFSPKATGRALPLRNGRDHRCPYAHNGRAQRLDASGHGTHRQAQSGAWAARPQGPRGDARLLLKPPGSTSFCRAERRRPPLGQFPTAGHRTGRFGSTCAEDRERPPRRKRPNRRSRP